MNSIRSILRRWNAVVTPLLMWLMTTGVVLAQDADAVEKTKGKTGTAWIFGYILVVLLVALGLITICRLGKRSAELPWQDTEDQD